MSGLEPGFQLGHYRITRSLGSGGMADVYEAHDEHLDRVVALKILPMEYSRNQQLVQRFQKEVRAAAKLNHRNIVTVFEVGHQDNWHFFSMRLLTGGDLRGRIQAGLTPIESLAILREVADAFAHAHARGFVHRDVKPENIMFDEQGFPVLTDFGIAKALDANTHMTRTGMTMGTPRYLSPEQASGKPVDARADLYSLGIILHEMLTGRPPYDAEEAMAVIFKHVTEPIPVMPPDFLKYQPLLEKLMAKDANQRIASAADLIKEIDALFPRAGSGEFKQSALRTTENPLVHQLMTPSPLRTPTPMPRTPAPVTPPPVRPPPVSKSMTAPPASPAAAEAPAGPVMSPRPRAGLLIGVFATVAGIAVAGYSTWRALRPDPGPRTSVAAPATAPAEDSRKLEAAREQKQRAETQRQAEQLRQQQQQREAQEAAQRQQAEAEARKRSEAEAAAQAQARRDEAARQQAEAEARSRRREAAEAEAQRKAAAESEARRKAAADAEARRRAESDAQRRAEEANSGGSAAEIERRAREADRAAAARRRGGKAVEEKPAEETSRAKPAEPEKTPVDETKEEDEALERSRRPTGF